MRYFEGTGCPEETCFSMIFLIILIWCRRLRFYLLKEHMLRFCLGTMNIFLKCWQNTISFQPHNLRIGDFVWHMVSSIAYKIQMETIFDKSSAKLCYLQHSIPNNFNFCSIIPIHYFMFLSRIGESLLWSIWRCPSPLMSRRGMVCSYASVYAIHPSAQRDECLYSRGMIVYTWLV